MTTFRDDDFSGYWSRCTEWCAQTGGNYSSGVAFNVIGIGSVIWGMDIYCPFNVGSDLTLKCSLWNTDGTRFGFDNLVVPANSPDFYRVEFTSKLTIDQSENDGQRADGVITSGKYIVSVWETTGTYWMSGSAQAPDNEWGGALGVVASFRHTYGAGDARPTSSTYILSIDPIVKIAVPSTV
jgi:hypothetical protein